MFEHKLVNSSITFHCDNSAIVDIINKQTQYNHEYTKTTSTDPSAPQHHLQSWTHSWSTKYLMRCYNSSAGHHNDPTTIWHANTTTSYTGRSKTKHIQSAVNKLVENAASPTTNRRYQQQWTSFVEFHQIIQIPFNLPSTSHTVSMFTAHLQQQGLKSSTIQTYLTAISNRHKLENLSDPTATYLVTKTLQGIKTGNQMIHNDAYPSPRQFCSIVYCQYHSARLTSPHKLCCGHCFS